MKTPKQIIYTDYVPIDVSGTGEYNSFASEIVAELSRDVEICIMHILASTRLFFNKLYCLQRRYKSNVDCSKELNGIQQFLQRQQAIISCRASLF